MNTPLARVKPRAPRSQSRIYWRGNTPHRCEFCQRDFSGIFIDGKAENGWWVMMDPTCHRKWGTGLGTGKGQRYEQQTDGRWLKVEG